MSLDIDKLKNELRKKLLSSRKTNTNKNLNLFITSTIFNFLQKFSIRYIGLYFPLPTEIDILDNFIKLTEDSNLNYQILLPKIKKNVMFFSKYEGEHNLIPSNFKQLLQPSSSIEYFPEIIILPGLAFSYDGYRLGFGMGYYDKYLYKLKNCGKFFITIGITLHENLFQHLPFTDNDFKLDYIITDKIFIKTNA